MGVAIDEMAHLALVNNVLVALGGAPHFIRPNLPIPPGYHPAGFVIRLAPLTKATLDHFVFLGRPAAASALFLPTVMAAIRAAEAKITSLDAPARSGTAERAEVSRAHFGLGHAVAGPAAAAGSSRIL